MVQWHGIALDRGAEAPLYRQLEDAVTALIEEGSLAPGAKLPPSRELAHELGVNRNTVTSAYEALRASGLVHSHVGQGTFVLGPGAEPPAPVRWQLSRAVEAAGERVRSLGPRPEHSDPIDFASLVPDEELFPIEPFRKVLDEVVRREGKQLLQYGPAAGHPPLRAYIAERLTARGVTATADNVLIVNGSQQGLDLICRTLLDPGDEVALESPTYTIVLPLLAQYHARIAEIPMTERGLDLEALERAFERGRPKLVFTMPTFHNPTGITLDLASRRRLLELASRYSVPIVEDDYDSELRFDGRAVPPLKALDSEDRVLHIGTFSKGLFPGLRLGWIVAPRLLMEGLERSKLITDYHTSLLLQAAVLEFCRRGHYDAHLERLASIYRSKSRKLTKALERHFPPDVTWTRPEGGYAFWITLPEGLSAEALRERAEGEGVFFTPGGHFFVRGGGDRFFRLSISRVPVARIDEGIARLGGILRELARRREKEDRGQARSRDHEPALHI